MKKDKNNSKKSLGKKDFILSDGSLTGKGVALMAGIGFAGAAVIEVINFIGGKKN